MQAGVVTNLTVYTDGAYSSTRNQGGVGIVFVKDNEIIYEYSKCIQKTTNNRCELIAVIKALQALSKWVDELVIYSDSQYVIRGASEWLPGWKKRNWCNSSGEIVAQVDLWKEMDKLFISNPEYDIDFIHVKGHTKNTDFDSQMNDMCDKLCTKKLEQMKMEHGL